MSDVRQHYSNSWPRRRCRDPHQHSAHIDDVRKAQTICSEQINCIHHEQQFRIRRSASDDFSDEATLSDTGVDIDLLNCLKIIRRGEKLMKFGRRGSPHVRYFFVDNTNSFIHWHSRKKSHQYSLVAFSDVTSLQIGQSTPVFARFRKLQTIDTKRRSFSLIYTLSGECERSLDIMCSSLHQCQVWVRSLRYIITRRRLSLHENPYRGRIRVAFDRANIREKGIVDSRVIVSILKELNWTCERKTVKSMLEQCGIERHSVIDVVDFFRFMKRIIIPPTITQLFDKYSSSNVSTSSSSHTQSDVITFPSFHNFLLQEQQMTSTMTENEVLFTTLCGDNQYLSRDMFVQFLFSQNNSLADLTQAHSVVDDMTYSMSDYFINSSHNTYLENDQLKGSSSVNMYASALKKGCRCVELDCWDGPRGEPIIYHGFTLTSKLLFCDVIETIRDNAFTSSPYPVILSIENHCSAVHQSRMSFYLQSILSDSLIFSSEFEGEINIPSPQKLMYRVLVKAKMHEVKKHFSQPIVVKRSLTGLEFNHTRDVGEATIVRSKSVETLLNMRENTVKTRVDSRRALTVTNELSSLVIFPSIRFTHFENLRRSNCRSLTSFSEKKITKLAKKHARNVSKHNRQHLSRVYPSKFRVDSSNFCPFLAWSVGCQLVALNFQTLDLPMLLNLEKFSKNKACGYVLKPSRLRTGATSPCTVKLSTPCRLAITIIAAFHLPLNSGEVVNASAKLIIRGEDLDCKEYRTSTIVGNGLSPYWNQTFEIKIHQCDMAIIAIQIASKDTFSEQLIAQAAVSVSRLRRGYRFLPLVDTGFNTIPLCGVFVHILQLIE